MNKQTYICVGHYGSGKTTIALNLALFWAKTTNINIALADLDVNNPYFRSRDWKHRLDENKIQLIIPDEKIAYAEMPFLPKEIYSIIQDDEKTVIIDLGGYDVGTKVIGSLSEKIRKIPYDMWLVVNIFRPETETVEDIKNMFFKLQSLSTLKITGLINNTNLGRTTQIEDIIRGEQAVLQAAEELGVPFIWNTVSSQLIKDAQVHLKSKIFPIESFNLLNI